MDFLQTFTSLNPLLITLAPFIAIIVSIILHEVAHGYVAYRCGDMTAKLEGRLTLNPIPHIDPIGTIALPILLRLIGSSVVFGWAKPVPINYYNLRGGERDFFWVSFAGIAVNLTLAILFAGLFRLTALSHFPGVEIVAYLAFNFVLYNILLALFNLMPIPPLDGSRLLRVMLPDQYKSIVDQLEPFGFFIVFMMLFMFQDRLASAVINLTFLLIGG